MPFGPISQPGASARLPDAPTSVSASATAGTVAGTAGAVTVSFVASTNPGKGPGNYVATSSTGVTASSASSPISFAAGTLAAGTANTFSIVKQSGSGISSASSVSSGAATPFTIPSAPVLTLTNTDNTVDWTWSSGGTGGSAITGWEYALSTNNGAFSAYTLVGAGTFSYPDINNYRNQNFYKLKVRAVNAAGPGPDTESSNSTPWTVSTSVTTFSENSAPQACASVFCGTPNATCGSQAQEQVKTRTVTRTTTTYTRGASSNSDVVDTAPDFSGIAYGACYNVGGCSSVGTSPVSGTDGQIVYVGGTAGTDYRTYSSFFGNWAVTNSGGTYTMQVGQCGGSCSAQNCFAFSTSIQYCSVNGTYIPVGYIQLGACANSGFGCISSGAC